MKHYFNIFYNYFYSEKKIFKEIWVSNKKMKCGKTASHKSVHLFKGS